MRVVAVCSVLLALGAGFHSPAHAHGAAAAQEKRNKEVVLRFAASIRARDMDAAAALLSDSYVQHDPAIPPGKAGFVEFFSKLWKNSPPANVAANSEAPALLVAEGDIVIVVFRRPRPEPDDPTRTYDSFWFDSYRLAHGKLVEHWDPLTKPPAGGAPAPPS